MATGTNIFDELLNSLKGMAQTDVGGFKAGAARGGRDVLGIESLPTKPVDPESVMSVQPAAPPAEPNMSVMPPVSTPLPQEEQASIPEQEKVPLKPTPTAVPSVARRSAPAPAKAAGSPDDEFAMLLAKAGRTPNHDAAHDKLTNERNALMDKSDHAKDMTDQEKVATALIAALPALLGAIGGGALAGGAGAAAGVAGGLTGAGQGISAMAAGKEAARKEAKTDADKIAERIAHLDEQIDAEKEKASDRTLSLALQERAAKKTAALEHEKMAQSRQIADDNNRTQLTNTIINNRGAMDRAQLDAQAQTQKALLSAKASGSELKDYQGKATQFATSMLVAKDDLDKMHDSSLWNTMTTWSGLQSALSDPKRQKYARAALNYIDAVTRDVSGAAITPSEWETKFRQYLPTMGSSPQDIEAAQHYRDSALNTMLAKAGPGRDIAIQSWQMVQPQGNSSQETGTAPPNGHQTVVQNGVTFNWNGQSYVPVQH